MERRYRIPATPTPYYGHFSSPIPFNATSGGCDPKQIEASLQLVQMFQPGQDDLFTRLFDLAGEEYLVENGVHLSSVSFGTPDRFIPGGMAARDCTILRSTHTL